ncbi:Aldehyde dehydrogenase family 2 member C4 [Raphanus sativus]|uniref:aldehyde dehydrogenase (NAD(+)) n=1 Tax=Raphanus sativus TaxID=3726 RepID=A0A6J0NMZ5_RAPSA|nr:aldehyde dehydrogenase family 2 member C4 [Raphanus sativus]XP_056851960.1 aldehyde dehydrogenase family 2 member C4 [Raphanus sativus]KAJ4873629.1 Aldehyde dehydrogenase family 2 member C4 [Raphanus sativus]KAJ4897691.1 Aldehyde dehydrogenase family 2 member C4 [Raphanus sativus]
MEDGKCNGGATAVLPEIKFTKLFINGQFLDAASGKTFETIDPRNGEVIAKIAAGDKEDVDLAVNAARHAFDHGPWPRMTGFERARIINKYTDLIEQNIEELAALDSIDGGKLFHAGKMNDIPAAAGHFRYYAGAADKIHGETLRMTRPSMFGYTLKEPIGVVGHIIPWNFPSIMFAMKVAPALAAGCTMVVKPAEQTPLSALFYAHLSKEAGFPDGVINVVTGFGTTAGAAISSHMDIDKVSFTGSTDVGRKIMQAAAASNLKKVSLELGGKSPLLIFDDADVNKAAELALLGCFYNKGEICVASSRVFVQEGIYDKVVAKMVEKAKDWTVGDPFDSTSRQGPQVDKKQYEKILSYIEHGKNDGATLLTGGNAIGDKGYFIEPTIFADVTEDMKIYKEEIFGPVMSLMKFKTIEEGIKCANNTKYGLAAGIVSQNIDVINTVSRSIRAGVIWVNCYFAFDLDSPYGGYKMSGNCRESGMDALDSYLQVKSIAMPLHNSPWM